MFVCPSVGLSVTRRYCVETAKHIIKRYSPSTSHTILVIKPPLATARAASCIGAVHLFVCLLVCLSVAKMQKNAIFSKTKQFGAMVSIVDLYEVM